MLPAITEVKRESELIAGRDGRRDLDGGVIFNDLVVVERLRVNEPDPPAPGELELMKMRQIPPRESLVNRVRKPQERVRRTHDENPPRTRLQPRAMPTNEIHPNLKPCPRHAHQTLRDRF